MTGLASWRHRLPVRWHVVAFLVDVACRCFLPKAIAHLVKRTRTTWDDVVFGHKVNGAFKPHCPTPIRNLIARSSVICGLWTEEFLWSRIPFRR